VTEPRVDPDTLALQLTGLLAPDGSHIRQTLLDTIETRLPRDPEARINIQLSELGPGRTASWHVHNGIVYFVLLRGIITLQYEGSSEHFSAGDVYTEPIGVVHRPAAHHRGGRAEMGSPERRPPRTRLIGGQGVGGGSADSSPRSGVDPTGSVGMRRVK
jgi:quercetin dioxygenase-like cupin family protein